MIVTSKASSIQAKATPIGRGQGHIGSAYHIGKRLVKTAGLYPQIEPYLPETYLDPIRKRYGYKPRKRITGHALSTRGFLKKAPFTNRKYGEAYSRRRVLNFHSQQCKTFSKSSHCS